MRIFTPHTLYARHALIGCLSWLIALASPPLAARDVSGSYAVFGIGSNTCDDYLDARYRGGADELIYVEWISGHLSAYNLLLDNTYNILGNTSPFDFMAQLDAWCRQHRDQAFTIAIARQMEDLFADRANLAPHQESGWGKWIDEMTGSHESDDSAQ